MKLKATKKIFAAMLILGSIITSVLIISSSHNKNAKEDFLKISANLNDINPYLNFKTQTNNGLTETTPKTENKILTDNLTEQLLNNGPFNQNGKQSLIMPSQELLEKLLADQLAQDIKIDFYETTDLKISNDNSPKAIRTYLEAIDKISKKDLLTLKKSSFAVFADFFDKKNQDSLYQYIDALSNYTTDLLKISVPSAWQAFHLELLNIEQKRIAVYQALANMDQDPVKALIAANELEKIDQAESDLAIVLKEKLKDLSI